MGATRGDVGRLFLGVVVATVVTAVSVIVRERAHHRGVAPLDASTTDTRHVKLCLAGQPGSALAVVALKHGLFAREGLDVEVFGHVSGKRALTALLAGEGDMATVAEVPLAFVAFDRQDFRIIAEIGQSGNSALIVADGGAGITSPDDLRGKRIGTQRGSAVHFFLHMFLSKHRIPYPDIALTFMPAEDLPKALIDGRIDAFSMREPYVSEARAGLGERTRIFAEPGIYKQSELVVVSASMAHEHPDVAERLLRGLLAAETLVSYDRNTAVLALSEHLGISEADAASAIAGIELSVRLDQSLLLQLEDEASWIQGHGLVEAAPPPNFLSLVWSAPLAAIRPERVSIIQ